MANLLNNQILYGVAHQFGIEIATLETVIEIESSGSGFFTDWNLEQRIKIQFEPHIFVKYFKEVGKKATVVKVGKYRIIYINGKVFLKNGVEQQKPEWEAFNKAWTINPETAMMATSFGLGQIMGFNYKAAGFNSVGEMVAAFKESEEKQLIGMMNLIKNNNLITYLQKKKWAAFAERYNGPSYKDNEYDKKLKAAYEKHSKYDQIADKF